MVGLYLNKKERTPRVIKPETDARNIAKCYTRLIAKKKVDLGIFIQQQLKSEMQNS